VQIQFLIGPAGSGKTHCCLAEIREELARSPEGPPLILLAPKQATFQLERQLLADDSLQGYTRLQILSFERMARFILRELHQPLPKMLDEEGRLMVLRSLLAKRRNDLKLFRAGARLAGFAAQLSLSLRELQRQLITPEALFKLAEESTGQTGLSLKLHDLAVLHRDYLAWLKAHDLQDADCLLAAATAALNKNSNREAALGLTIHSLWLDGFAEFSPSELDLLTAVVSRCERATLAFCLDRAARENVSWLSTWSFVGNAFDQCRKRLGEISGAQITVEELSRRADKNRFASNPILAHLEKFWSDSSAPALHSPPAAHSSSLQIVNGANPDAEAELAAKEILKFVRAGGRFREASVIVRSLETYHHVLQRAFSRFDIPFFLDRRESVSHHPLAELTRSALRLAAFNWPHEDWFAALKTGLAQASESEIDRLENQALARGWKNSDWLQRIEIADDPALAESIERLRRELVPPFQIFIQAIAKAKNKPTGRELADSFLNLWRALDVENTLEDWASSDITEHSTRNMQSAIHATVWDQMNSWLDNLALAFPDERLALRDWLPILEAGLANLSVGVIPPALDQVLVGAIDRSRNPDIKLAIVLGLNEGVFPAPPQSAPLLTDSDREELEHRGIELGNSPRRHIARERFFGYIAMTRARQRLVLSYSTTDSDGRVLNPSPFVKRVQQLFPQLEVESIPRAPDWHEAQHASELIAPLLQIQNSKFKIQNWETLAEIPWLKSALDQLKDLQFQNADSLSPALAEQLYGRTLRTSVSRLEQFAACPFRFFVHSGLRAEERKLWELDVREQGSFQHDVLKTFHEQLQSEGKRWRDITPIEARERVGAIAQSLASDYRNGLLSESDETKFTARVLTASLQDFVETLVGWMHTQYAFDPVAVEVGFGSDDTQPFTIDLGDNRKLALYGRIDRVDLWRENNADEALCVVLDYKSSEKKLEPLLIEHGLQLQLLAYLNVLRQWPDPKKHFGVERIVPAGVFYVNLRGKFDRAENRGEALAGISSARKLAYRHTGRFDARVLAKLDSRDAGTGDQFHYRKTKDGALYKNLSEPMQSEEFLALLEAVESNLQRMGTAIFAGDVSISPFRKGATTACQQCDYQSICRIDPWTHPFRALKTRAQQE
jgi:ATP-dependent helicase/nuclease subunit B